MKPNRSIATKPLKIEGAYERLFEHTQDVQVIACELDGLLEALDLLLHSVDGRNARGTLLHLARARAREVNLALDSANLPV